MSEAGIPAEVLHDWRQLNGARASRITTGLINDTYRLDTGTAQYVLQCLHPVFNAEVNYDIQAVTGQLIRRGLSTPSIVPTDIGTLWSEHNGRVWRLLSYVAGHTVQAITDNKMAFEAGRITAQFHAALDDFQYDYQSGRGHVHDTTAHLNRLTVALTEHDDHRLYSYVKPCAEHVLETVVQYEPIDELPLRHCHGDLKISNILFDDDNNAVCLIDLDTVNRMAWPLEMGDALRSWCNPRNEDQPGANLNLMIMDAAMSGYATAMPAWLGTEEKEALVAGLARICLELSARFLADALNENYFGWNRDVYPSRGDHNLARGKAMAALYDDVMNHRRAVEQIVKNRLLANR